MNGIAANWQLDFTLRLFESVLDKRKVDFFDSSSAKRFCKSRVGEVVFGDDDEAGRFLVQPVHDSRTELIIRLRSPKRESLSASKQCVHERSAGIPGSSMDAHSGWFVDDEDIFVFVGDFQRDCFRFGTKWRARARFDDNMLTPAEFLRRLCHGAIHQDEASPDQLLQTRAGELRELLSQPAVKAHAETGR